MDYIFLFFLFWNRKCVRVFFSWLQSAPLHSTSFSIIAISICLVQKHQITTAEMILFLGIKSCSYVGTFYCNWNIVGCTIWNLGLWVRYQTDIIFINIPCWLLSQLFFYLSSFYLLFEYHFLFLRTCMWINYWLDLFSLLINKYNRIGNIKFITHFHFEWISIESNRDIGGKATMTNLLSIKFRLTCKRHSSFFTFAVFRSFFKFSSTYFAAELNWWEREHDK